MSEPREISPFMKNFRSLRRDFSPVYGDEETPEVQETDSSDPKGSSVQEPVTSSDGETTGEAQTVKDGETTEPESAVAQSLPRRVPPSPPVPPRAAKGTTSPKG